MKVMVTGGSGFLGSQLVDKLLELQYQVVNVDRLSRNLVNENYTEILCDINDLQSLLNADVLIHCAAVVPVARNNKDILRTNYAGTERIAKIGLAEGLQKFIYISSSAVYGKPITNPVKLSDEKNPGEVYGRSKLLGEEACNKFRDRGLPVSIIRPRTVVGNNRSGIFGVLFNWIQKGHRIPIISGGNNRYQFVDIEDFISAIILIMNDARNLELNIGAGDFPEMHQTLSKLCDYAGSNSKLVNIPRISLKLVALLSRLRILPFAPYHWQMYGESLWFDIEETKSLIPWSPKYDSLQALTRAYDSYLAGMSIPDQEKVKSSHLKPTQSKFFKLIGRGI